MGSGLLGSGTKGLRKNNLAFWHLIFTPSSAAPQSRNSQRRPGYVCGFAQSFAAKSGANGGTKGSEARQAAKPGGFGVFPNPSLALQASMAREVSLSNGAA